MAVTTAQRNAGAYQILLEMAAEFPAECDAIAWILVRANKNGNAQQKEIATAVLNGMVQAKTGQDMTANAALRHRVRHFLLEAINRFEQNHPGVGQDDCYEPQAVVVS